MIQLQKEQKNIDERYIRLNLEKASLLRKQIKTLHERVGDTRFGE